MEALQSGQSNVGLPPSALPSATSIRAPTISTAVDSETSVAPTQALFPTDIIAPEPTLAPTETATVVIDQVLPTPEATFTLPTRQPLTNEQRWRAQEINRRVFDQQQNYTTLSSELWWYDPINQQHVILGTFTGDFLAQAQFTLRGQGIEALEVPYQVNKSYGLTALSPAIIARIAAAGGEDWIETYVFVTPNVAPR
ncbi:hypothetical protein K2Z83_03865 [Oscillochloris sp. ZM17-4]|uniref:hypothetical protein n=1 Tax=Oscillochloris sp. ZM17-4 TaxID=2866714 RepID=UPI001C72B29C|nr:hypothetical protein [Oscillochloris sp. ZM17-4]MBX0326818.1 hypothetical protein [Oscillochloris sp. ZM17-4]